MTAERGPAYRQWLARRTVAVVGLARSGVAAARLIRRLGGRVLASDSGARESLSPEVLQLEALGCALFAGGHPEAAFAGAELVVVSPGVPLELPALEAARARGVPVIGELELGWRVMEADLIAITGTNGKTTTTALTGDLAAGTMRPVFVGGNIGTPLCAQALDFPADGLVVAEASSFQLDTTERLRPRVAVVLNLTPDHLDRHRTFERYVDAKAKIFANQDAGRLRGAERRRRGHRRASPPRTRAGVVWFSRLKALDRGVFVRDGLDRGQAQRPRGGDLPPLRDHPARPAQCRERARRHRLRALDGARARRDPPAASAPSAASPHRIERVLEERGVAYYNDSKGTNVASTIKALESFTEPIVLIAGGKGKGQDFSPLADAARGRVRQAVLIGADRAAIRAALEPAGVPCADATSMREAVATARSLARTGEVVLLSPACASFDMFDNFEHRGDVFMDLVRELTHA